MYLNNIDKKITRMMVKLIDNKIPILRKRKYPTEYFLKKFIYILKTGVSYRNSTDLSINNHYSSIFKKITLWNKYF